MPYIVIERHTIPLRSKIVKHTVDNFERIENILEISNKFVGVI